jgi:hypothetical protein
MSADEPSAKGVAARPGRHYFKKGADKIRGGADCGQGDWWKAIRNPK